MDAHPRRVRVALATAVLALAGPLALVAAGQDAPPPTRCADADAVTRAGDWEAVRGPAFTLRPGGRGPQVAAYAVHPVRPQVRFATNGTSVERTDDGGCTWREVYALPAVPSEEDTLAVATAEVQELVVPSDPRGADRLLVVLRDGNGGPRVMASDDGGRQEPFRDRSEGLPPTGAPRDLHVATTNPDFLFLGVESVTGQGSAPDDGLPAPLPDLPSVPGLPQAPTAAASPGALYGSVDGGLTWEARIDLADLGGSTRGVDLLAGHPTSPNRLWAVSDGILRSSTDGGRTFAGPGPTPEQQQARGWRVTAVVADRLISGTADGADVVLAFSATSAQDGGPVLLSSPDGGRTYDETPAPGVVDSASAFLPGTGSVVFSTLATEDQRADVHLASLRRALVPNLLAPLGPPTEASDLRVSADLSSSPTFHARTAAGLLRYVGPAAALPPELPPLVGGAVLDTLPPLGPAQLTPATDVVRLRVGQSRTVGHSLVPPRRPGALDLYLVVDTSISMADDLPRVSADLLAMVERLEAEGVDVSVGLGEFKGGESSLAYRRVTGVGPGTGPVRDGLGRLVADGYGLEAQLIALEQALEGRGEQPGALLPAACKFSDPNPDRFTQAEKRTAPLVQPGQQADFRAGAVPVVVMVTDTNFLRPAGTRLKPDCSVDVESVAARYAAAGVHVVGLGVDDVDNPQRAADMLTLARTTGALQPRGAACAPGIAGGAQPPAVCRSAVDLVPTLESLATRPREPLVLTTAETGAVQVLQAPDRIEVDLRRAQPVALPVTYACADAGTFAAGLDVRMGGRAVARLTASVVCDPVPEPALPLLQEPALAAAVPLVGLLPPPAALPPPAPPAQAVQPQVQTQPQAQAQSQAQTGTQEQERTALELALALQSSAQEEGVTVRPMAARAVPDVVRITALAAMTAAAGALAVRRRPVAVRAPGTRR